jgi:hypothetical protein
MTEPKRAECLSSKLMLYAFSKKSRTLKNPSLAEGSVEFKNIRNLIEIKYTPLGVLK